ncbi:MAG: GNAT family N-acetyltransferase [Hyphomonadaceae bacterium]
MFKVRRAASGDVGAAIAALGDAFAEDPLMLYLFHENPQGIRAEAMGFFSILLRARIALGAPAYVLERDADVLGAVMGYDTSRPAWPEDLAEEMRQFEASVPGFAARIGVYGKLAEDHEPKEDHYYLGVIGVHPSLQGKGAGKALLDAFCQPSRADPKSSGVYLETASASSLEFYYRNGFELSGEGALDGAPLWCVYKRT